MSRSSEAKEVLMIYATSHGVRREDIVSYAKGVKGVISQDFILQKAIRVEEFQKSHTKEHGVEEYRDAVRLFGILYAGCNTLEALEARGLEGGFLTGLYDTFTVNLSILAFVGWFIATHFINIAFDDKKDKNGNKLRNSSLAYALGDIALNRTADTVTNVGYRFVDRGAETANNLGGQAIAWTGIVTAIIVLPIAISAAVIFRK